MPKFVPIWFGLHNITCWFYWFYIGMFIYKYKETLYKYIEKYKLYIYFLLFYAITTYLRPIEYGSEKWYSNLSVTGCLISIIYLMDRVNWSKYKITIKIVKFSRYSFGIYIWHNWVAMMLISNTSKQLFELPTLAAIHIILFPLCFSLITLAISWFLSWGMMKTRIGRFLIG